MQGFLGTVQLMCVCGSVLVLTFIILLALPNSRFREILMPIVGWIVAAFCAFYCINPVDILPEAILGPFGLPDDISAAVVGILAAASAMKSEHA